MLIEESIQPTRQQKHSHEYPSGQRGTKHSLSAPQENQKLENLSIVIKKKKERDKLHQTKNERKSMNESTHPFLFPAQMLRDSSGLQTGGTTRNACLDDNYNCCVKFPQLFKGLGFKFYPDCTPANSVKPTFYPLANF